MYLALTDKKGTQPGLQESTVRDLVRGKSAGDLAGFVLRGLKGDRSFRRKVLAWLIAEDQGSIADETAQEELLLWVEDVFVQKNLSPRTPKLADLKPVKSAVRSRPSLAVPVHIAVADAIADFLSTYGGGPESLYSAYVTSFREAARNLALLTDPAAQRAYFAELEGRALAASDFGYGMDAATAECLEEIRMQLPEGLVEAQRLRRRPRRR